MSTNTPDSWVVVRMKYNDKLTDKVLAGWYGGYLDGDSWKLSSGIITTEEFTDRYEFTNYSGSLYICYKQRERMSGIMSMQYAYFEKQYAEYTKEHPDTQVSMELIEYSKE